MCGLIVRVRVVPRSTVVGDIDRRFDNLSGSHHQSHVNCVSSVYGIYISGQLSRDVIDCFKSNRWLSRDVIGCWFVRSCCYLRLGRVVIIVSQICFSSYLKSFNPLSPGVKLQILLLCFHTFLTEVTGRSCLNINRI